MSESDLYYTNDRNNQTHLTLPIVFPNLPRKNTNRHGREVDRNNHRKLC